MQLADLAPIADPIALYSAISQERLSDHLDEELGEYRWDVDLGVGQLSFTGERGQIDVPAHLIASIAPGPRSLLWGWALPQAADDPTVLRLRDFGDQHEVGALTQQEVAFPPDHDESDLAGEIAVLSHQIGQAAVAITGAGPYYSAPTEGSARVVLLMSDHDLPGPRIDERLPRQVVDTLAGSEIHDHRTAVHHLAARSGWQIAWTPEWTAATLTDPVTGNAADLSFDEQARLTNFSARLSG